MELVPTIHELGPGGRGGRSTRALSIERLMPLKGLSALDLGCNAGYNTFDLIECGCTRVLGIEIREDYLRAANEEKMRLGYDHVQFINCDVRRIDEQNFGRFDLCLCTGLLYHMQNPFNLLKRMRNICKTLALETHIAPPFFRFLNTGEKYRINLRFRRTSIFLDDQEFSGRLNVFPIRLNMKSTSGSIDSHVTFWLSRKSLIKAVESAGFRIRAFYYGKTIMGLPEILIDHGYFRTKVFILADVEEPTRFIPVGPGVIQGNKLLSNAYGEL